MLTHCQCSSLWTASPRCRGAQKCSHAEASCTGAQVLTKVPVLIIMDCSTEVSRRRVGLRGLPGSTPSSATGPSPNSWLGAVEVKFSQDCTLSSPKDAEVTRGFGWAVGMPAVYHSTSERRMFTKHCNACMHIALHLRPASHGDIYA